MAWLYPPKVMGYYDEDLQKSHGAVEKSDDRHDPLLQEVSVCHEADAHLQVLSHLLAICY